MQRSLLLLSCSFLIPLFAEAQVSAEQSNIWTVFNTSIQVGEHWWLLQETSWRRNHGFEDPMQFKAGINVEHRTGPWGLSLGYAYWLNYSYGAFPSLHTQPEHRISQQVVYKHTTGRVQWSHRFRIEERFVERFHASDEDVVSDGFRYLGRLRYQVQPIVPLWHPEQDGEFALVPLGEVILRYGDTQVKGALDQFRLGLFGAWRLNPHWQLRAGYMLQYLVKTDNVHVEHNHTLVLALNLELPLAAREAPAGK